MSICYGDSPFEANLSAYDGKKSEIKLNEEHNIFGFIDGKVESKVTIMHLDVDNLTSRGNAISPYEISSLMFKIYARMSEFFLAEKSLSFFMGGDNFMVVANSNYKENAEKFIDIIKNEFGIHLNCGVGTGKTARSAVKLATRSLDTIREIRDSGKEKPEIYELI